MKEITGPILPRRMFFIVVLMFFDVESRSKNDFWKAMNLAKCVFSYQTKQNIMFLDSPLHIYRKHCPMVRWSVGNTFAKLGEKWITHLKMKRKIKRKLRKWKMKRKPEDASLTTSASLQCAISVHFRFMNIHIHLCLRRGLPISAAKGRIRWFQHEKNPFSIWVEYEYDMNRIWIECK